MIAIPLSARLEEPGPKPATNKAASYLFIPMPKKIDTWIVDSLIEAASQNPGTGIGRWGCFLPDLTRFTT